MAFAMNGKEACMAYRSYSDPSGRLSPTPVSSNAISRARHETSTVVAAAEPG